MKEMQDSYIENFKTLLRERKPKWVEDCYV